MADVETAENGGTLRAAAEEAGLVYVDDSLPGLTRKRSGTGFRYLDAKGAPLRDKAALARIRSLAVPPAYTDVWICPRSNGHIQATGRDAKGRKQYRYHPDFRQAREANKFSRIMAFANALPAIRQRVDSDMKGPGLSRDKVLATVVHLLETTLIRVGNDDYARTNKSYGLTTLRDPHVRVDGAALTFRFKGKSGKIWNVALKDRRVARIVKACQDLPGQELFQYIDTDGTQRDVTSSDVNAYLREIAGEDFTAKDFRTWAGTVLAALALREFETFDSAAGAKRNIRTAIESVAGPPRQHADDLPQVLHSSPGARLLSGGRAAPPGEGCRRIRAEQRSLQPASRRGGGSRPASGAVGRSRGRGPGREAGEARREERWDRQEAARSDIRQGGRLPSASPRDGGARAGGPGRDASRDPGRRGLRTEQPHGAARDVRQ